MSLRHLGYLVLPLAIAATAATVFAQTTTTTTTIETRRDPLNLSPTQRTVIYRTVSRERRVVPGTSVQVRVGSAVPPAVVLSPIPESVYVEVPEIREFRYFYVNNQLVLVDPRTSEVVDIIDQ